jgi:acetyl-CoA carboxylase biotin carboxylase subunit
VHNNASLNKAYHTARSEAERAFGNGAVYVEKFLENPRHVEIQILADSRGRVVHLGERDCSIQRRHQKLIEEAPSPAVDADIRKRMGRSAVRAAEAVGYVSVGTVEFVLDANGKFFFIEMNTRIQVEHPVTEAITGIDLVREQIRVAAGEPLGYDQRSIRLRGHAMECRVNAEDAFNGFRPSPGCVEMFVPPGGPGIRVDTHVYSGYEVPTHYDSMLAKVVSYGVDRTQCLERMNRALDEFMIDGVKTTIPLEKMIINHPNFVQGRYSTNFVDEIMQSGLQAFI